MSTCDDHSPVTIIHLPCHYSKTLYLFDCSFDEGPIPNKKDSVETQISNFLTWMEVFMEKNRNKKNTYATYKLHMQRMLKIWIDKKCLSSVYALWNLHDTDLIPVCDPYVDKIDSDTTKEQACNAYKKVKIKKYFCVTIDSKITILISRFVTLWNVNWANNRLVERTWLETEETSLLLSCPTETWLTQSLNPYEVVQRPILFSLPKDRNV